MREEAAKRLVKGIPCACIQNGGKGRPALVGLRCGAWPANTARKHEIGAGGRRGETKEIGNRSSDQGEARRGGGVKTRGFTKRKTGHQHAEARHRRGGTTRRFAAEEMAETGTRGTPDKKRKGERLRKE
ncbi:hypothetical protein TGDOM2_401040 [Toxoplasma gondii GAB2-2007-GAL-DOM2]|uniref:Uncharacterized protein n=1 Tax=Toxoplasma gondii GAB2-2007-GAL-DOM2 TaxID=1130820 RepID=A0A086JIN2_TOXGO|nr:hypothetical protein TGDOM2_401040 [Toxoplasma gondii GAB2-2007-GAL-DOM2]